MQENIDRIEFRSYPARTHFNAFGTPTLLGDLLVSSTAKPAKEVHLPVSRNINERIFLRENFYIAGLTQKVVLLNGGLAIAWSGNFASAADFFSCLEPLATSKDWIWNM